jgi:hypothetical protein
MGASTGLRAAARIFLSFCHSVANAIFGDRMTEFGNGSV